MWALHLPSLSKNRSLILHLRLLQQNKPLCVWERERRVRTVPQKEQKYWLTIDKVKLWSKLCSQSTFSKSLFDGFQFGVGKKKYEKYHLCSVLDMATMASCCGHISSHRRISQSHTTRLAGSPAAGRCHLQQHSHRHNPEELHGPVPCPHDPQHKFWLTWQSYSCSQRWAVNLGLCWVRRGKGHFPEQKWDLCSCSRISWSSGSSWGVELCEGQDTLFKLGLNPCITLALCSGVSEVSTQDSTTTDLWLTTSDCHRDHRQAAYGHVSLVK